MNAPRQQHSAPPSTRRCAAPLSDVTCRDNQALPQRLAPLLVARLQGQSALHLRTRFTRHRRAVSLVLPVREALYCDATYTEQVLQHAFVFNNERHQFGASIPWLTNPSDDVEWHILLHKFYYAVGLADAFAASGEQRYVHAFVDLCCSWVAQTPNDFIAADVTGRRVQNWLYAYYVFSNATHAPAFNDDFLATFLASLAAQVNYLCQHLAPARNHRTLALYAIFLAGIALPEMADAERWRSFAGQELAQNLRDDFLDDGVHVELSSDYHHLALRSLLLWVQLARANEQPVPADVLPRLQRAFDFALHVHRPDGAIAALSDADSRSFLPLLDAAANVLGRADLRYVASAGRHGCAPTASARGFDHAGYYFCRSGWGDGTRAFRDESYLVIDCGPVGAGNHGHLDALNFEYAAFGRPLVVDPGRYTYNEHGAINWRARFRGTAYHNTVTVDGLDQTGYAYSPKHRKFRVHAEHAQSRCLIFDHCRGAALRDHVDYFHGLVRSPRYDALHHRHLWRVSGDYVLVADRLFATHEHDYALRFFLTPAAHGAVCCSEQAQQITVWTPVLQAAQPVQPGVRGSVQSAFVSTRYGEKQAAPLLLFQQRARDAEFTTLLAAHDPTQAPPALRIFHEPGSALTRVECRDGSSPYVDVLAHFAQPRTTYVSGLALHGRWFVLRFDLNNSLQQVWLDSAGSVLHP